jgi:hypothetical protein
VTKHGEDRDKKVFCVLEFDKTANLPGRWTGSASDNDSLLLPWPPRSPDITSCDFLASEEPQLDIEMT